MGREPRFDAPGWIHHVYGRGLGRRPVFEDVETIRVMQGLLGQEVRAGRIEVLPFTFMTTHFHLGLVSLRGELSAVMQRVESCFVRWFNRRHNRDGPLFRSRFGSRRVKDDLQLATLVRYIDANPVTAGIVEFPEEYPHGSAFALLRGPTPDWLSRRWFDYQLEDLVVRGMPWERAYRYRFSGLQTDEVFLVEQRMRNPRSRYGDLDDLIAAAPEAVIRCFRERAENADGGPIGTPIVGPVAVAAVVSVARERDPARMVQVSSRGSRAWPLIEVGLLRHLCAMSFVQIGQQIRCSSGTACQRHQRHRMAMRRCPDYEALFAGLVAKLLTR